MAAPTKKEMEKLKENVQRKFEQIREALSLRERLLLRQIDVIATSTQKMTRGGATTTTAGATPSAEGDVKAPQELRLLTDNEEQLLCAIRSYGKFNLDNINLALLQDSYMSNEDYIAPSNDHETMYKCLKAEQLAAATSTTIVEDAEVQQQQSAAIVVDFSKNKSLIEKNVSNMNESIINITLAEAKELIRKAKTKRETHAVPPLNLEELADEQESSIAEAVSSLGKLTGSSAKSEQTLEAGKKSSKKQRFKPKITINNCNGVINLRNISNLTINCASEETLSAELPLQQREAQVEPGLKEPVNSAEAETSGSATVEELCTSSTGNSTPTTTTNTGDAGGGTSSNYSSNASSRTQSQKHKHATKKLAEANKNPNEKDVYVEDVDDDDDVDNDNDVNEDDDEDVNAVHCEFYNRLLNEIKNSLKKKSARFVDNAQYAVSSSTAALDSSNCDSNSNANNSTKAPPKRFVLKNFENLKIVLESNGVEGSAEESFHPVQIEQWLAEIISETDLEPMQNTDILEHSLIHEKCKK